MTLLSVQIKKYGGEVLVTITPYGRDVEPNVPEKEAVMEGFKVLSDVVGVDSIGWRYEPIFRIKLHNNGNRKEVIRT